MQITLFLIGLKYFWNINKDTKELSPSDSIATIDKIPTSNTIQWVKKLI